MAPDRHFDVVLFGPTGVTGREVARHLARRAPALGRTWAVAGRSEERMRAALDAVGAEPDGVLIADVTDPASLLAMAESATVVANLVGPYADYGEPVHAACAAAGTAQLDLTGELDWVLGMIARYGEEAERNGARIVPTCGFESLPFDLATHLAAQAARDRHGEPLVSADAAVTVLSTPRISGLSDMVSGGTYGSIVGLVRRGPVGEITDPYLLDPPEPGAPARGGRISLAPRRHAGTRAWLAPMLPAAYLNPAVVHRGAALSRMAGEGLFTPRFRYREGTAVGGMLPGAKLLEPVVAPLAAGALAGTQLTLALGGRAPAAVRTRLADVLARVGPKAGDGPPPEVLDEWRYRIDLRGATVSGQTVDVVVEAVGHPGYKSTATMVGEAALLLADPDADRPDGRGYLSPATALGVAEVGRFAEAGATFTVVP